MRKFASLSLPLLLLGACAAGPDYHPPVPPSAVAAGAFTAASDAVSADQPRGDWWRLYDDPALDRIVTRALAANSDLRVAAANLARAEAVLRESGAARLPATNISGGAAYGDGGGGQAGSVGGDNSQWSFAGSAGLSWEVDLAGRIRRALEAAAADRDAVAAARNHVAATVAAETTRAYIDACSLAEAAAVARASVAIAARGHDIVAAQARFGSAARFDVERAATALAHARAQVPPIDGARQVALFELAALMGLPPAQVPQEAAQCVRTPGLLAAIPVGNGAGLIARRPDIREAERQLAAATARIGVATADLYPRISLGASGQYLRSDDVRGGDSFGFSLGPLLSWSFPNQRAARARIAQAEAGSQAALAIFDGAVLTALKEAEQALAALTAETGQQAALAEAVRRAEAAHDLADQRYRAGASSYLEFLDAQRALVEARHRLALANQALGSARVDLFKALGGGWQALPATTSAASTGSTASSDSAPGAS
ncbi:efflux transporter outer membrane subunit [Sphingopyxis sp. MWB1]|uniref:efflux transporter outer membrane subunit n=1 Tax=Sphingopyxis sp. MWB1 TaxID=1537715 RepID=UPI00051A4412|nr:TolC family protein [Sphingopyxis sp. MWB1]